jgi:Transposase DDE domain group 1
LRVMRDARRVTVDVTANGAGLVSHAGSALLGEVAEKLGVTRVLSLRLAGLKQRRRGHDPGRVIRDLAVMLGDDGECVSDLGAVREQDALFGRWRLTRPRFGRSTGSPRRPGCWTPFEWRTPGRGRGFGSCLVRRSG